MAQVDFSNAKIEPSDYNNPHPMGYDYLMQLDNSLFLYTREDGSINTNANKATLLSTSKKISILYTGTFTKSGNYFYLGTHYVWKVSNITYNAGDTYSFVVEVEVNGNT